MVDGPCAVLTVCEDTSDAAVATPRKIPAWARILHAFGAERPWRACHRGAHGGVFINTTGNPGMASGGTGDVLTGMIGSLLAQGHGPAQAACLGVYLHGLAGDLAAEDKGEAGMIAGDVIEKIPQAIKTILQPQMNADKR